MKLIDGISAIVDTYDLFVVDQWGVLHDGESPYPGAVDALENLRRAGKRVVLLSNSARRAAMGVRHLDGMGIPRTLYDDLVTSGEETWRHLHDRPDEFYRGLGTRCLLFSWGYDRGTTEGTGIAVTESVAEADFILNAGTNREPMSFYEPMLRAAAARGLPMICANPDLVSVAPDGELVVSPGAVARRYEELGGSVRYHGKPGRAVYEACFARVPGAGRAIGIGDSLHHDVAGAHGAGIDALLIAGGVHAKALGIAWGAAPDLARLEALAAEIGHRPDCVTPVFRW